MKAYDQTLRMSEKEMIRLFDRRQKTISAKKCYRCGKMDSDLTKVSDGHQVCRDCLKKHYEKCMICGEYADQGEIWANGGLCELCYDEDDD